MHSFPSRFTCLIRCSLVGLLLGSGHAAESLPQPHSLLVAPGQDPTQAEAVMLAARRYAAFWHSGESRYAEAALAGDFIDRTLPKGRPQGPAGALAASAGFRQAVPDLSCEIEELLVLGERAVLRLRFKGHFSGRFGAIQGDGRAIDFRAVDIYRIRDGRISDNWHLEDNLTLMRQLGVVAQE